MKARAATPTTLGQALQTLQTHANRGEWSTVARKVEPALDMAFALAETGEASLVAIERSLLVLRLRAAWELAPNQLNFETSLLYGLMDLPDLRLAEVLAIAPGEPPSLKERLREAARNISRGMGVWRYSGAVATLVLAEAYRIAFTLDELRRHTLTSNDPDLWLALASACLDAGRPDDAARYAQAGRALVRDRREHHALSLLEARALDLQGGREKANRIWQEVWTQKSDLAGLLALWDRSEGAAAEVLQAELERAYAGERPLPLALQVRMEILLGDAELPLARLQAASPERWWADPDHPAKLVVPFLLRIGCGHVSLDPEPLLIKLWRRLDNPDARPLMQHQADAMAWTRRVDAVLASHPTWATDARVWRIAAGNAVMDLASEVIKAKAQNLLVPVALFLVAAMEASTLGGDADPQAPLTELERRFPRHRRLRAQVVEVMDLSPILRAG